MGGMLGSLATGFLSGAGQGIDQAASTYQNFQNAQALDAARSDLQVQAAQRIAENQNALQNREQAQTGAVYQQGRQGALDSAALNGATPAPVTLPPADAAAVNAAMAKPADSDDTHAADLAGVQALLSAGKTQEAQAALAQISTQSQYETAKNAIEQSGIRTVGYGGKLVDTGNLNANGAPTVLDDNSVGRTEIGMANAGAHQTAAEASAARAAAYASRAAQMPDQNLKEQAGLLRDQSVAFGKNIATTQNAIMMTADPAERVALAARIHTLQSNLDSVNQQQSVLTHTLVSRAGGTPAAPAAPVEPSTLPKYAPGTKLTDAKGNVRFVQPDGSLSRTP